MTAYSTNAHNVKRIEIVSSKIGASKDHKEFWTLKIRVYVDGMETEVVAAMEHTLIGGETAIPVTFVAE